MTVTTGVQSPAGQRLLVPALVFIALVSVASTIGIGVGYPLAGLLTQFGGLRAAYGLGAFVTAVALLIAVRAIPAPPPLPPERCSRATTRTRPRPWRASR